MRVKRHIGYICVALVVVLMSVVTLNAQINVDTNQLKKDLAPIKDGQTQLTDKQRELKENIMGKAKNAFIQNATSLRDSAQNNSGAKYQVSMLTCGPGEEIYEYYGHSAIRILRTDSVGVDVIFNYGVFDFTSGNFALRFALGHTDYICAMQETEYFVDHYRRRGIYIDEQVLNMTQDEAQRLFDALLENAKPENCVYRYNFFYDNCATRVRDMIEKSLNGTLEYPSRPGDKTLRDAIHKYSEPFKWSTFGQDLLVGSDADLPSNGRELEFAPLILRQDMAEALITDQNGMVHTFVSDTHRLLDLPPITVHPAFPLSPLGVAMVMLLGALVLGFVEIRKKKIYWPVDTVALIIQGVAGIIVAFLFFFSTHPTVGSNWQIWVLNPLPLIGLWWQIRGGIKKNYRSYHIVAAPIILSFIIALPLIPQQISSAMIVLACFLLIRSLTNIIVYYRIKKK